MHALAPDAAAPLPATHGLDLSRSTRAVLWTTWAIAATLGLGFLAQPVGVSAQLALSCAAGAAMLALWMLCPRRGLARMTFLALGSLVVLRYIYWRLTCTLPGIDDPLSFGLGLLLATAELYCVLILAVSLIVNADPLERTVAPALPDVALPSVDVFIPSYNESSEILSVTLAAARNLDYPADRVTVWLLDDGGTDQKCADANPEKATAAKARRAELQALCADLGARYLTRAKNEHAKAGNMNGGLKSAKADLVLVLDADHAPFRSFLRETVGLFSEDQKLFLVQTPHVFLNPDPVERNLRTFAHMPSENEMFYSVTQRGLDKWNGSFFCGSAALLRRKALDEVGGFSGITITEDCETAFELHSRGWTSAYVDKPLIAGLQPETFADFIGQRARWCQGMFQIMLLKNPLVKPGLEPIQRLAYLSSMTFWFFPLPRLIFMLAPLLHIFFDVKIFVSSIDEALAFTATYVVANMMMQNYLYGRVRWPWISELYEYVQGVYLARSIVSVLASPRKPSFNVTAKGVSLDNDHLSALAWPYFAIFGALAAGCAMASYRYLYEPGVTSLMLVVGLWCLFNLVIAGAALGVVAERRQPERCPSLPTARRGWVSIGTHSFEVAVERVSSEGALLRRCDGDAWPDATSDAGLGADTCALAVLPGQGGKRFEPLSFALNGDASGDTAKIVFTALTPQSYLALADLMYGDPEPLRGFLGTRRKHKNLLSGSLRFLAWGVSEPVRAFAYGLRALRKAKTPKAEVLAVPATKPQAEIAPARLAPPAELAQARIPAPVPALSTAELPPLDIAFVISRPSGSAAEPTRAPGARPVPVIMASTASAEAPKDFAMTKDVAPAIEAALRPRYSEVPPLDLAFVISQPSASTAEPARVPASVTAPTVIATILEAALIVPAAEDDLAWSIAASPLPVSTELLPLDFTLFAPGVAEVVSAPAPAPQSQTVNLHGATASSPAPAPSHAALVPLTAEAWRSALRDLIEDEPAGPVRVTGFDPAEWRACVASLDAAERTLSASAMRAEPAAAPNAGSVPASTPEPRIERRPPVAAAPAIRNAA